MRFSSAKGIDLSWVDSQVCYEGAVEGGMEGVEKGRSGEVEEKVPVLHGLPLAKVLDCRLLSKQLWHDNCKMRQL